MKRFIKNTVLCFIISIITIMSAATAFAFDEYEFQDKNGNTVFVETLPAENGARVLDEAGIFTEDEIAAMEESIRKIRETYDRDVAIVTNNYSGEKGKDQYAAEFWTYGGYGCGDDQEGIILYINMDPENRGWWACATGPDSMEVYDYGNPVMMDNSLKKYLADGRYGEGVLEWINQVGSMYKTGLPTAPDWYPDRDEETVRYNNPESHEVDDEAGLFTEDQIDALAEEARELSGKYGIDIAITTTDNLYSLNYTSYGEEYYKAFGIGYGENYDGILLTVFPNGYTVVDCNITAEGKGLEKLSEVNMERLCDQSGKDISNGNYYAGAEKFLKNCDHMLKTGRVPKTAGQWVLAFVIGMVIGSIFGLITLLMAKKKMAVPAPMKSVAAYLAAGSLAIEKISNTPDIFLTTDVSRVLNKAAGSGSSSSGSGGNSSYTSHYEDSSGTSHTGSGGSF